MKNNKYKATTILLFFSIGFLVSYPFHKNNFWMGLLSAVCAASMIGGLADWFAVTAIFRKPLGLTWPKRIFRTQIIPQNRDNIIRGLVDIVENELLSKESIKKRIMDVDLVNMLSNYLNDATIEKEFQEVLTNLINEFYKTFKKEDINGIANGAVRITIETLPVENILSELVNFSLEKGYESILIDYGIDLATGFIKHGRMHLFFTNFVEKVISEYENGSQTRAMTVKMLMNFVLKKSTSDIAIMVENNINEGLNGLKLPDNFGRAAIKKAAEEFAFSLKTDESLKQRINEFIEKHKDKSEIIGDITGTAFEAFREENSALDRLFGGNWIDSIIEKVKEMAFTKFNSNMEGTLKEYLIGYVNSKHSTIGAIVRDNINQYSTEQLVALIEGVAGNDLQMIRINGSVVGGLVGMLTYLITYWVR